MTPKYRKHSQRDFAFVEYQGSRIPLPGKYNSPESRAAYRKFLRDNNLGGKVDTLEDLVLSYLDHCEEYYGLGPDSQTQHVKYRTVRPLLDHDRHTPVARFGPRKVKDLMRRLAESNLSVRYVNHILGDIKRMWKWAASEELINVSLYQAIATVQPYRRGKSPARDTEPRKPVVWETVEATLPQLTPVVRDMVLVQWYTGVRSQSLCAAAVAQFERRDGLLLWLPKHKTEWCGKTVILPIGPRCEEILQAYLDRDAEAPLFSPRESSQRCRSTRFTVRNYWGHIARAAKRAGAEHWHPHQLRHARARFIREKYGVEAAQAILGHDSLDATQLYSDSRLQLAIRVAKESG